MDRVNVLIIGGGVVGCAIAEALSLRWQDVFLVEQFPRLGMSTSTRNSGVIHSGIYYPTNSWKARHCVEGNRLTKEFCEKHNVAHRVTGKLVVAKSEKEEPQLLALLKKGQENGVEGLEIIDAAAIRSQRTARTRLRCAECSFHRYLFGRRTCSRLRSPRRTARG